MEASAIKQMRVGAAVRTRTPLLRMQSDERLVALVRRGHQGAFTVLVGRYETRLFAFCRHLLRSREDAEDVLQEVFASAFKAMGADERPINVRPWLYRIARNRCLNHLRRCSAIGVDSIEEHVSEHGPSTSEAVQRREDLWLLVGDIRALPESQRSALLLRELEALSYEQIADVLDKTVPSVKSLLIRARRGLAESAEVRALTCEEAMVEVGECHLSPRQRLSRVVRRHIDDCPRCEQLGLPDDRAVGIAAWLPLPLAPLFALKKLAVSHFAGSANAGSTATATAAGSTATAAGAGAGASSLFGGSSVGFLSASVSGIAGKAAVSLTAVAIGLGGAVAVENAPPLTGGSPPATPPAAAPASPVQRPIPGLQNDAAHNRKVAVRHAVLALPKQPSATHVAAKPAVAAAPAVGATGATGATMTLAAAPGTTAASTAVASLTPKTPAGSTVTQAGSVPSASPVPLAQTPASGPAPGAAGAPATSGQAAATGATGATGAIGTTGLQAAPTTPAASGPTGATGSSGATGA
ncbi:MAG: RNA polymerase sigma factor [Solirubrobacteraceae bacterium]